MRNLGLWNPGYRSRESGNPLTIGSRNPCSTERKLALFRTKDNVLLILLPPAPAQLIYFSFLYFLFFLFLSSLPTTSTPTLNSYFNTASRIVELYITTTTITTTFLLFPSSISSHFYCFPSSLCMFSFLLLSLLKFRFTFSDAQIVHN